jgi:hypothetical protein
VFAARTASPWIKATVDLLMGLSPSISGARLVKVATSVTGGIIEGDP